MQYVCSDQQLSRSLYGGGVLRRLPAGRRGYARSSYAELPPNGAELSISRTRHSPSCPQLVRVRAARDLRIGGHRVVDPPHIGCRTQATDGMVTTALTCDRSSGFAFPATLSRIPRSARRWLGTRSQTFSQGWRR